MPLVSVIIVNYNGQKMLRKCLASLLRTIYYPFEIIVVDNASRDGSVSLVQDLRPIDARIRIVQNKKNLGFALGNNIGASYANGKYLVFLNNDTEVQPSWLRELIDVVNHNRSIGATQSKLLIMNTPNILDFPGGYLTQYGTIYSPGMLERDGEDFERQSEILVAKGAALLVRKSLFFRVGEFDPRFFCYNEELDLCWRIWLSGHSVVFVPHSVVYHALGGTTRRLSFQDSLFFYHGHKNYINTLLKNLSLRYLVRYGVPYVVLFFGYTLYSSARQRRALYHLMKAYIWNAANFRNTYRQRILVQKTIRRVTDDVLLRKLTRKIGLTKLVQHYAVSRPRTISLIELEP